MGIGKGLTGFRAVAIFAMIAAPATVYAHTRWVSPVPRTNDSGLKAPTYPGPCGNKPRTTSFTQYEAGATIPVSFIETIDHVGCFQIALDSTGTDTNFVLLSQTVDQAGTAANTVRNVNVKLPNGVTCEKCTLQLRQLMKTAQDPMCAPDANPNGANTSTYYSCADIRIGDFPDAAPPTPPPAADAGVDPTGEDPPGAQDSPFNPNASSGGNRNLRAGAGDDGCSVGWGSASGIPAILAIGLGVLTVLRRRRR